MTSSTNILSNGPVLRERRAFSRRDLLGGAVGSLAVAALSGDAPPAFARAAGRGLLIACMSHDITTLNPAMTSSVSAFEAGNVVYDSLLWLDKDRKLNPGLAERIVVSDAGDRFTFHLKKGVKWHDGAPFSAADVHFTLGEIISKFHPIGRGAYKYLAAIETPDEHTVVVQMTQAYLPFLEMPFGLGPILPRHLWQGTNFLTNPHNVRPIGTGPYRFVQLVSGQYARFRRNEDYHVPDAPGFDDYIVRVIPDATARRNAFLNREVDIILSSAVSPTDIAELAQLPAVELHSSEVQGGMFLCTINLRSPIYSDRRVRQAIAHAIDRAFIRRHVLRGIADPAVGPLWPGSPLYDPGLQDYAFDPARANLMLDAAGHAKGKGGIRFECRILFNAADITYGKIAEVFAFGLSQIGVRAILTPLEQGTLAQLGFAEGHFDLLLWGGSLGPDPDSGTERLYNSANILPQAYVNNSAYSNPEVDRLFQWQRVQTSTAKRKAIYSRIQRIIWRDIPVLPIGTYRVPAIVHGDRVADSFKAFSPIVDNQAWARPVLQGRDPAEETERLNYLGTDCAQLPWPFGQGQRQ